MSNNIKVGTLVRPYGNNGVLCRVRSIKSDGSSVQLTDWAYGHNYIGWVPVAKLVYVGND